jgi:hypothetical protein
MNTIEKKMVDVLRTLKNQYSVTGVKSSLEAEGIRLAELLRIKEIALTAGVGSTIKIGGCEALTDIRMVHLIGFDGIMSPMIESAFALEKFLDMAEAEYSKEEIEDVKLLINIETVDGYEKIDKLLAIDGIDRLYGIVLGRTDLSNALHAKDVDSPKILQIAREIFTKAKRKSISCMVGGGITPKTIPFLKELGDLVDGFETRKVIFHNTHAAESVLEKGIRLALGFEHLWYQLKQEYYSELQQEDAKRMKNLSEFQI